MRYIYLELENYIGIYNGMGLSNIRIDLTKSLYKTLVIKGANGSGKSTLFKAFSVFPDSNDSFIPGLPAKKVISIMDRDIVYNITFIHGIKSNGDRDTTKAYVDKLVDGLTIQLNDGGNISAYKDVISAELSLDPNFVSLSQLSLEDKGLASKKPAERKKFVNAIISSLEVYNDIYKTVSKKSSNLRSVMDSVVSKLGSIGDINSIQATLSELNREIAELTMRKEDITRSIMQYNATMDVLDPDKSIQLNYKTLTDGLADAHRSIKKLLRSYAFDVLDPRFELNRLLELRNSRINSMNAMVNEKTTIETHRIPQIMQDITDVANQMSDKRNRINALSDEEEYNTAMEKYKAYKEEVERYAKAIEVTGIDPDLFTKDEYILALETLGDIRTAIDVFKNEYTYDVIEEVIHLYESLDWSLTVPYYNTTQLQKDIDEYENNKDTYTRSLIDLEMDMETLRNLSKRPKECTNDSCYFISNLLAIEKRQPHIQHDKLSAELNHLKDKADIAREKIEQYAILNACINHVRALIRSIDRNKSILSRLPNGGIFSSKSHFFQEILNGNDLSYVTKIYEYIDLANTVELYHMSFRQLSKYDAKIKEFAQRSSLLESLNSEFAFLEACQCTHTGILNNCRSTITKLDRDIENEKNLLNELDGYIKILQEINNKIIYVENSEKELSKLTINMEKINACALGIVEGNKELNSINRVLTPKIQQRDSLIFSLKQAEQYNMELAQLREEYDKLEIIKRYSSPTTGIQLVYMELYMGKILHLANELLSLLFKGEYTIQPFIINESEFRIPCLGNGYLNDDISSMSTSQLTMISMILSFSLLFTSSTNYNVLKIDEIDGPLDNNNKAMFIDVMNRIMAIMNVEQCIMVSHSSELQLDTSDLILLRHDEPTIYSGNVLWQY